MIAHLPRCLATLPGGRYACNCGAAWQNELAAKLDALPPIAPRIEYDHGPDGETYRIEVHDTPPANTPLRAVARMLRRLAASATHHDAARHLLATAGDAVELAAGLAPEEAVRVLDAVEPPAEDGANAASH